MPAPPSTPDSARGTTQGYRVLPAVYDRWQQTYGQDFTSQIYPRLLATLQRHEVPVRRVLDAGCGTGELVFRLAREGWSAWGVDMSEGMIRECERKRVGIREPVPEFFCQDIRAITLPRTVGLVTSMFDVLNHLLTPSDLLACCRSLAGALEPSGLLVFDVNNERCYRRLWTRNETISHPHFVLTLRNRYEPATRRAFADVTLTMRNAPASEVLTETVEERCYLRSEISRALRAAGFEILESEDFAFGTAPEFGKLKTWWVARKRGGEAQANPS